MNGPIVRLFGLVLVLFALLVFFTSRWTVFDATQLDNNTLNVRTLLDELKIKRGRILADNGQVLARSVPGPGHTWTRTYPTGSLFAQPVGYSIAAQGRAAGLEQSDGAYLRGQNSGLSSIFGQLSPNPVGDDVQTTLDPAGQRAAQQALAGMDGSVVALDPRTGAVLVMYSNPTYNDNNVTPNSVQYNRATQGQYAPGSTFKIVTATAGIDSGKFTPDSTINGNSPLTVSGVPLENDGNQSWGPVSLTTALVNSINTVFVQVAQDVGRPTMTNYMKRFGFYSRPPLDYPSGELSASQPFYSTASGTLKPFRPGSPDEDIGRIGIGEGGILVTPLQMAMVAAAVANGGKLMSPHMTSRVIDPDGRTVQTLGPTVYQQVMKPSTAQQLGQMMQKVVEEGTGQEVQLGNISVAGKTGTAQIGANGSNITQPSFVAFAPAQAPTVAIAVMIDKSFGGFGGSVAAPIAKQVLQALLAEGK